MHLYIITLCVNASIDNSYIAFSHLYCLLHPYVLSYIITSFMNKLLSYLQWMKFFICSNVVAALWLELSKHSSKNPSLPLPGCFNHFYIYSDTHRYWLLLIECGWRQMPMANFNVKFCLQYFSIITFCHNIIVFFQTLYL